MATGRRLDLAGALEDAPQTRRCLSSIEKDADALRNYVYGFQDAIRTMVDAQTQMSQSTESLAQHLLKYKEQEFAEKGGYVAEAVEKLAENINELRGWQDMLATQTDQAVLKPVTDFLTDNLGDVDEQRELFETASQEHENAMVKYSKTSKKKETDKARFEANADLYIARKKFHEIALQYYSTLNALQYKRKISMLNPLISIMHSQLSYFKMGHEILTDEVAKFLTNLTVEGNKIDGALTSERKRLAAMKEKLEKEYASKYNPDPDPSDPFATFEPPNLKLKKKCGHLFMKSKQGKWERYYFFTTDGALMLEQREQDPEMVLKLDGAVASFIDVDDRRYVFQILSKTHTKPVYLQSENQKSCEEWIAAIHNIATDRQEISISAQMAGSVGSQRSAGGGDVREERMKVRNWIDEQMKQASQIQPELAGASSDGRTESTRVNPFSAGDVLSDQSRSGVQFSQAFTVRFLGSTEVTKSKGVAVIYDTMRRVLHARAVHGVFKMVESTMIISTAGIKLLDPATHEVRTDFHLKDVSFCASHVENPRLLGFITKSSAGAKHACHVFETDKVAKEICESTSCAMQIAFEDFIQTRQRTSRQQYPAGGFPGVQSQSQIPASSSTAEDQQRQSQNKTKKGKSKKGKGPLVPPSDQLMIRRGQIDASAAQNSWSGGDTPPVRLASQMIVNPRAAPLVPQPVVPPSSQTNFSSPSPPSPYGSQTATKSPAQQSQPEFGMFNPFFRDEEPPSASSASPASKQRRSAGSGKLEFDSLVPNSTPVDPSILDAEHGFNVDLLAALNQASFGSPRFPPDRSPSSYSPDDTQETAASDALAQLLKLDDIPPQFSSDSSAGASQASTSPAGGGISGLHVAVESSPMAPIDDPSSQSTLRFELDSAVDAAMQLAKVTAGAIDNPKPERTNSNSSLSDLSD